MAKKKKEHYVNNKEFLNLLIENKELETVLEVLEKNPANNEKTINQIRIKKKRIHNKLGEIFLKIARGYACKPNFLNYTIDRKEDMISDAVFYMSKYVSRYNVEKSNPFSYFTQACHHAFLQYINKQKRTDEMFQPINYIENVFSKNNLQNDEWD